MKDENIFCSSPNCKNQCGKKYNYEDTWRNPEKFQGLLFLEYPFCDEEGNKINSEGTNNE